MAKAAIIAIIGLVVAVVITAVALSAWKYRQDEGEQKYVVLKYFLSSIIIMPMITICVQFLCMC